MDIQYLLLVFKNITTNVSRTILDCYYLLTFR